MEKKPIVFRQSALEHVNRPVLLDDALQVVSTRNWLILLILTLLLLGFIYWLFYGNIYLRVQGNGMLLSLNNPIVSVQSSEQGGVVQQIYVQPGQRVHKNMLLVRMDSELGMQLQLQKNYLIQLKKQQADLTERAKTILVNLETSQKQQIEKINSSLAAAQQKIKQLETMMGLKETAYKKGILDLPNVTETRIEYYRLLQEVRSHEADLISMKANLIDLKDKWRERQLEMDMTVQKAEYDYNLAEKRWELTQNIISPTDGVVAEIKVKEGDLTRPGEPLLTIAPAESNLYALIFIPATKGKLLKIGMTAQIAPSTVNKLEYGTIQGRVETISLLPVTAENMMTILRSQDLVRFFNNSTPLIAVKILLDKNNATHSGYQWTSSKGPDINLTQGTVVEGMINVEAKKPIELFVHFVD
ncbi:NHLP bacteriocin system secretion protein [Legionella sp. 16cNR16C]|uniref:NHLP bacteriocin system secretion protein n=1 Tax=Legionella sp. 16cNR16C TaxID=2905656 RepID=UPI001E59FA23|nr:NHLP bacteriocin system secretion protein [Legionella sp. 16cNR16C]MCE3043480.1 NHLP bacteriocin system secretion protein [Legionella sp. 16cNR16C]